MTSLREKFTPLLDLTRGLINKERYMFVIAAMFKMIISRDS
jgi:hypothetical protein